MPLFTRFYTSHVVCLGFLNHQQYLVWKFPASPTLIVASQAQVARSSVQQITTLWLYITLCQSKGKKTIHIGKYRKYRFYRSDVDSVDWFFNSSWQWWVLWPVSSWEQLRPPDRNLEDHEGGWQRHYNLNVSSNIYHGKGMAVSCHHENWQEIKGCFIRIQVALPKKIAGKFLEDVFIVLLNINSYVCFALPKKNMCSQKPWHYQKQKNVVQIHGPPLCCGQCYHRRQQCTNPIVDAVHCSPRRLVQVSPTKMVFPAARNPSQLTFKHHNQCEWLSSAHLHQVPSPNISASWHSCDAIEPLHLGFMWPLLMLSPPQRPNRFLRFMPTKQVEQAATVHNPRSCLGVQGVFCNPPG